VPAFLLPAARHLLPLAAISILAVFFARTGSHFARKREARINSVDGFHTALEIDTRSSYVPRLTSGV
jgi:hypothetical protein